MSSKGLLAIAVGLALVMLFAFGSVQSHKRRAEDQAVVVCSFGGEVQTGFLPRSRIHNQGEYGLKLGNSVLINIPCMIIDVPEIEETPAQPSEPAQGE